MPIMPKKKLVNPKEIFPKQTMGRNEPCWCHSGMKWKNCHRDRNKMPKVNVFKEEVKFFEVMQQGTCCYPDPAGCNNKAIRSHTIQRSGGLASIAESGHVLTTLKTLKHYKNNNDIDSLMRVGIGRASVFPGFCEKHDAQVFREIENDFDFPLGHKAAFLLGYRAVCFEYQRKEAALKISEDQRQFDKGTDFLYQAEFQSFLHYQREGQKRGLEDLSKIKNKYDNIVLNGDYEKFNYYYAVYLESLPFVASFATQSEFTFDGVKIQDILEDGIEVKSITVNVVYLKGKTVLVLGWLGDLREINRDLIESFVRIPSNRKIDVILNYCLEYSENIFLKESWWKNMENEKRASLADRIRSGIAERAIRSGDRVVDNGIEYFSFEPNIEHISWTLGGAK